jgi:hypothetical protein
MTREIKSITIRGVTYPAVEAQDLIEGDADLNGDEITILNKTKCYVTYSNGNGTYKAKSARLVALWAGKHPSELHRPSPSELEARSIENFFKQAEAEWS